MRNCLCGIFILIKILSFAQVNIKADFNLSAPNPYIGQSVSITDASYSSPMSWQWTITPSTFTYLNSSSSIMKDVQISFDAVGTYTINLFVSDSAGFDDETKFIYVSELPCDSLMYIDFPSYWVNSIDYSSFDTSFIDQDKNRPLNYLQNIEITDLEPNYGAENPDIFIELFDASNTLLYTGSIYPDTLPPVSWDYLTLLNDEVYMIRGWDEDPGFDDTLGSVYFNGIMPSSNYTDDNFKVNVKTSTLGVSSNWMQKAEYTGMSDSNYFIRSTSYFNPADTSDNWFVFGPVSVPSYGAALLWHHRYTDNAKRDAYQIYSNEFGSSPNNFLYGGDLLFSISDNDPLTLGDLSWTRNELFLDSAIHGNKSIYLAIHHNANNMWFLDIDNIQLMDCSSIITDTEHRAFDFNITPMPFSGNFIVELDKMSSYDLKLYGIDGRLFISRSAISGRQSFNTDILKGGIYILEVIGKSGIMRKKILKQ